MFNILNTILVAAIVTVEVYGLILGVYLMLFEGVTTREGVVKALEGKGYAFASAEIEMAPQNYITLTDEGDIKNMSKMLEMFDDNEDVQNVWHNWENEE